jgi:hypothetical protein
MNEPVYDVGISVLHRDEPLALELESQLSPNLKVFVYSKKQEQIAGTDGMESFREVVRSQSRLNVVLFRTGWGETKFTRIELTARQVVFESNARKERGTQFYLNGATAAREELEVLVKTIQGTIEIVKS